MNTLTLENRAEMIAEVAQSAKAFGEKHIRPNIMVWDESQEFPIHVFKGLGELGLMGVLVPEEYGGAGLGYLEYVAALVEISRIDPSLSLIHI